MKNEAVKDLYLRKKLTKSFQFEKTKEPVDTKILKIVNNKGIIVGINKEFVFLEIYKSTTIWYKYTGINTEYF